MLMKLNSLSLEDMALPWFSFKLLEYASSFSPSFTSPYMLVFSEDSRLLYFSSFILSLDDVIYPQLIDDSQIYLSMPTLPLGF